jgi:hypothetical protein
VAGRTWRVDTRALGSKTDARSLRRRESDNSGSEGDARKKKGE